MSNRRRTVAIAIAVFALAACVGNAFATGARAWRRAQRRLIHRE